MIHDRLQILLVFIPYIYMSGKVIARVLFSYKSAFYTHDSKYICLHLRRSR